MSIRYTRNLFLRAYCVVYLFAFLSFYIQIPGLYGKNGILPAHVELQSVKGRDFIEKFQNRPTLLWFASYLNLDTEYFMDILALAGSLIAFLGFVSQSFCILPVFLTLWSLYFSLFQVGQVFVKYQWDALLLEGGFLCLLLAPFLPKSSHKRSRVASRELEPIDPPFWLVRWLLFRLVFSTSINKLLSGCPLWWGLTALNSFFQAQPLPASLAWYSHHLPEEFLKLTTFYTIIIESVGAILFLLPIRGVRIFAYLNQVFLQLSMIFTGNFNFYNYLVLTLCISLLDDEFFYKKKSQTGNWLISLGKFLVNIAIYAAIIAGIYSTFEFKLKKNNSIDVKMLITKNQYEDTLLRYVIPSVIVCAMLSLLAKFRLKNSFIALTVSIVYAITAAIVFCLSTVTLISLHPVTNATTPPELYKLYQVAHQFKIVNPHGLWRQQVGFNGRLEIVLEGANNIDGPWSDVEFLYKPGNVNFSLPFVAPHSPRLDWQMWFAAQGEYNQNPWLISLAHRILNGQPEVQQLLNLKFTPFLNRPPKYIKANLYKYLFTPKNHKSHAWWTRELVREYFPIFSKNDATLQDHLKSLKINEKLKVNAQVKTILDILRENLSKLEGNFFCWSVFAAGCVLIISKSKIN